MASNINPRLFRKWHLTTRRAISARPYPASVPVPGPGRALKPSGRDDGFVTKQRFTAHAAPTPPIARALSGDYAPVPAPRHAPTKPCLRPRPRRRRPWPRPLCPPTRRHPTRPAPAQTARGRGSAAQRMAGRVLMPRTRHLDCQNSAAAPAIGSAQTAGRNRWHRGCLPRTARRGAAHNHVSLDARMCQQLLYEQLPNGYSAVTALPN